ncbi:GspH/FimT family pseudopilin [Methylophaga sp. OBS1]|uniref:GspH/FimT family pseudopilin n=1 Tax=Methylophaga sp. OBS1 TaxID=2991933 RepID=UPI00225919BB|nr:GspH/FimT family pseudopilin [Methylophaga sp. OBS1]MCX4193828.1 GspH/FimT family pseudopilin [Methylophaga sp. OBS1]
MIRTTRSGGFTLIELMITLSVVAILAAIAAPSFSQMLRDHRITTRANDLLAEFQMARSEAIKRGVQVTMMNRGNASEWESGWDIFTDWDRDEAIADVGNDCGVEGQDCWLRRQAALENGFTVRTGGTFANWIAFSPTGEVRGSGGFGNDTFLVCITGSADGKELVVNSSGSARVRNGDGDC